MADWNDFGKSIYYSAKTRLMLDWTGMNLTSDFLASMHDRTVSALNEMKELDKGAIANPDENRMVGHYWLRSPELAPTEEIQDAIAECLNSIKEFAADVHSGKIVSENGDKFRNVIVAGIGGSSLGPVFVSTALKAVANEMELYFLNNTDPDGIDTVLSQVEPELDETITVVISKSGGTIETRNCMEEARAFYEDHGLSFEKHAVCVTGEGSALDKRVDSEGWLQKFPMWDWVGGRTSVMSAVGLVPLALAGLDLDAFLKGAADCDKLSRTDDIMSNPSAILALSWYSCSGGKGGESMVVLPYKDSMELFAKYLQQLFMESLGKEFDLDGKLVKQGLAVLGNKGTSDQHSYVQQLVGGPDNVFITFVQILNDRHGESAIVGENSTSGDYLNAFMLGTKQALEAHGKHTMIVTVPDVTPYHVGQLIALFERAVGVYAQLIHINAYHQPAVEHGKKAAGNLILAKNSAKTYLSDNRGKMFSAVEIAEKIDAQADDVFRLMLHLAANDPDIVMSEADQIYNSTFGVR